MGIVKPIVISEGESVDLTPVTNAITELQSNMAGLQSNMAGLQSNIITELQSNMRGKYYLRTNTFSGTEEGYKLRINSSKGKLIGLRIQSKSDDVTCMMKVVVDGIAIYDGDIKAKSGTLTGSIVPSAPYTTLTTNSIAPHLNIEYHTLEIYACAKYPMEVSLVVGAEVIEYGVE